MRAKIVLLAITAVFFAGSYAQAGIVFSPNVYYATSDSKDANSNTTTKSSETNFDLRAGFLMPMGVYLGGIYSMTSAKTDTNGATDKDEGTKMGASVGYMTGGFSLIAHYFLSAEKKLTASDGSSIKFKSGSGFGFDIGYHWMVAGNFGLGPELSYSSITYTKRTLTSGAVSTDVTKNYELAEIMPKIGLWFVF